MNNLTIVAAEMPARAAAVPETGTPVPPIAELPAVVEDALDGDGHLLIVGYGVWLAQALEQQPSLYVDELLLTAFPDRLSAFGHWLHTKYPTLGVVTEPKITPLLLDLVSDYRLDLRQKLFRDRN